MARPLVSCESSLTYENHFENLPFPYLPNTILYNQPPLTVRIQQHFLPMKSCPYALIKPPFYTKNISRIFSWSLAPDLTPPNLIFIPKPHQYCLRECYNPLLDFFFPFISGYISLMFVFRLIPNTP